MDRGLNIAAIIQARMGSARLPGKVLRPLGDRPVLGLLLDRLARSTLLTATCVATSRLSQDDAVAAWCESHGVRVFRGDEQDVLARYAGAAELLEADVVVRITGDCPLICPDVTDRVIRAFLGASPSIDYATNCLRRTYPRGLDTEVVSATALARAAAEGRSPADREHVTHYIRQHPDRFRFIGVEDVEDHSDLRWTVDTEDDYRLLQTIVDALGAAAVSSDYTDLIALARRHPGWNAINTHVPQKAVHD